MKELQNQIDILTFQIKKLCQEETLDVNFLDHLINLSYQLRGKYLLLDYLKDNNYE